MSIELGLTRIAKLLDHIGNPHTSLKVLHIAGTNGKGSVCSYLSSILGYNQVYKVGKFTSPHLIKITDSITVNNVPVSDLEFNKIRTDLKSINDQFSLDCSEFELLTCTALKYFHQANCKFCILEVGLGGRLDATNVVPGSSKYACGITKIGLDHESFLGNSLPEIAKEKAGIITEGSKFAVVDGSNDPSVLEVVKKRCDAMNCNLMITNGSVDSNKIETKSWGLLNWKNLPLNGEYQIFNLRVAISILDHLQKINKINVSKNELQDGIFSVRWPGRLQTIKYHYKNGDQDVTVPLLLDGAHNGSAAVELAKYLRKTFGDDELTFIMAVTNGKKLSPLLDPILRSKDHVVITRFGSVEGMPWIKPIDPTELSDFIEKNYTKNVEVQPSIKQVLVDVAYNYKSNKRPVVICGSLYLCGEILRVYNQQLQK
ncbi:putative tetrahydrofolate synthase NDAI_0E02020 [Naumovozyma dairenensis CBS 421]|uniref:Dihydrofolate synthetase n=1 Tax=Naumovozyma dairenensis (strain ATCC 10597 / BCRC 20456 / CBS 421 / NBRC 0211 / NRRL Y-12639) TaxID=1071378 RepID=G0WB98_NAUDC|nr:hypothetical protein NDAI_0E02020 [Naumovozyma dairenensis CBS 421]CCD25018.1 hypothetical protein NDAI_0E02020 [Naumovozyma dairenensis CBS 421]